MIESFIWFSSYFHYLYPHLEFWIQFWASKCKRESNKWSQKWFEGISPINEGISLLSWECWDGSSWKSQGHLTNGHKQLKGGCKEHPDPDTVQCPGMGSNGHKVKHRVFCLNTEKQFLVVRVTEHWRRLPRNIVVPFWKYSKAVWTCSSSSWSKWPCFSRAIGPDALPKVPSHVNPYSWVYFLPCIKAESGNKYGKITLSKYVCLNNKF